MKKKILKLTTIIMLLVITYATIVRALSLTVLMETNSTTVAEATEFTVTVKVSNLDVGDNGINSLTGTLKYNKDIFEEITNSSIEGVNGWNSSYEKDTGKITSTKQSFVKSEESVFNVTLKTKASVTGKEGVIEFTDIKAQNSDSQIDAPNISVTILVGTETGNTANATNTGNSATILPISNNTAKNNTVANNTVNNTVNNATNTNNTAKSYINATNVLDDNIPETGVKDTLAIAIFAVVVVAIIVFIRIERINKEMNDK